MSLTSMCVLSLSVRYVSFFGNCCCCVRVLCVIVIVCSNRHLAAATCQVIKYVLEPRVAAHTTGLMSGWLPFISCAHLLDDTA